MQQPDLSDLSVIIVDDQRDFLRLFCAILRSYGVRKLTYCQKADEVTQYMRAYRFDMLFADVRMPEVDGIELIRRIRSDSKLLCRGLPIICVSAFSEQSAIQSAIRAGADDFLVKPVRPIDVYKRLATHLKNPLPRIKTPGYFGPDPRRATEPREHNDSLGSSLHLIDGSESDGDLIARPAAGSHDIAKETAEATSHAA